MQRVFEAKTFKANKKTAPIYLRVQ